jgi:hypothetical protein
MTRRASVPKRKFVPSDLAALPETTRLQICRALLVESGSRVRELVAGGEFVDLIVDTAPVWRSRTARVRLFYRSVTPDDARRLEELATVSGDADAVLIEAVPQRTAIPPSSRVMLIRAAALIERMEASALITWRDGSPAVDRTLFRFLRQREGLLSRLDAIGVRWLPWLGRNKIPPRLGPSRLIADVLLEEAAFRTFVMLYGFGGRRLRARAPGQALPDALLYPPGTSAAALLDCKAARNGFRMSASDYRAICEYLGKLRPEVHRAGRSLDYVVVLSSWFSGSNDRRHPYYDRSRRLRREERVALVYLSVDDLTRFSLHVEEAELIPLARERIDWNAVFNAGRPDEKTLLGALP